MADRDPSHPGQLLLDVIQTVPRSELFALSSERLLAMAEAVVDLGSRRRALLFVRADPLEHFVSCLVYLPRDRYTTAVRLEIEDILVREFGGTSLEFTARVTESPWALMHFMVRLGDESALSGVDTSETQSHPHPRDCSPKPRGPGLTGSSAPQLKARSIRAPPSTTRPRSPRPTNNSSHPTMPSATSP